MKHIFKKNSVAVVTYHFIRKNNDLKYKNINYLELNKFKKQISFFKKKFSIINFEDLLEVLNSKKVYKKPLLVLTFDDGYMDHYQYAYPILLKEKIKGLFYPFANILKKGFISDINKIHFILANIKNKNVLLIEINKYLKKNTTFKIELLKKAKETTDTNRRYGNENIGFIKRILQYYLPKEIRLKLNDYLFKKYVTNEIHEFANNLYLKKKNMLEMKSDGMHFGSHGYNHEWLQYLSFKDQEFDIVNSLKFLKKIFQKEKFFSICYPYGSYNTNTLALAKKYKFILGFTNRLGSIDLKNKNNNLLLPRYDTNDF